MYWYCGIQQRALGALFIFEKSWTVHFSWCLAPEVPNCFLEELHVSRHKGNLRATGGKRLEMLQHSVIEPETSSHYKLHKFPSPQIVISKKFFGFLKEPHLANTFCLNVRKFQGLFVIFVIIVQFSTCRPCDKNLQTPRKFYIHTTTFI